MKKLTLLIISISFLLSWSCEDNIIEPDNNPCNVSDTGLVHFERDAYRLAMQLILDTASSNPYAIHQNEIEIPQFLVDDINMKLSAIFDDTSFLQRDTVIHLHDKVETSYNQFLIEVDTTNYNWTKNLVDTIFPTGSPVFDSLDQKYNFNFSRSYYLPPISTTRWKITFKMPKRINTHVLAETLKTIPGVISARPTSYSIGDGSRIYIQKDNDYTYFTFRRGWGDCQSGCIHERFFEYKVHNNCKVTFIQSYGD